MAYSKNKRDQFLKMLKRSGGDVKAAAAAVGIERRTVYYWKKKDEVLAKKMQEIREDAILEIEDCLFDTAKKGNVTAQIFILTNLYPEKYRHVSKIQINRTKNELDGLTDAQLLKQIAAVAGELGLSIEDTVNDLGTNFEDIEHEEIDGQE